MTPERLTTADATEVVDVLADAFAGYPVLRYVLGTVAAADDPGLRVLVRFFACEAFDVEAPHHHLNMIGVRASHQGRGLARPLMEAVHALADGDAGSAGVTLTTETRPKLSLYDHFGYERLGHERVAPELETWGFFRASPAR